MSQLETLEDFRNTLKTMDDQLQLYKDMISSELKDYGLLPSIIDDIYRFTLDEVHAFSDPIIINLYNKHKDGKMEYPSEYDERVRLMREALDACYDNIVSFTDLFNERQKTAKLVMEATKNYSEYLASDEVRKKEEESIENLRERLKESDDESEKKRLSDRLNTIEQSRSLEFLFTRIKTLGKQETDAIVDAFFNHHRAQYTADRFHAKMKKFGFNPDLINGLVDIEVNFLGKDYYKFNNLFIFTVVRYVAHVDTYSEKESLFAQSIIMQATKLVYHRSKPEEEAFTVSIVKSLDDLFQDYADRFEKDNRTSPTHEYRISAETRKKEEAKKNAIAWLNEHNVEFDPQASPDELTKLMGDQMKLTEVREWLDRFDIKYTESDNYEKLCEMRDHAGTRVSEYEEKKEDKEEETPEIETEEAPDDLPTVEPNNNEVDGMVTSGYITPVDDEIAADDLTIEPYVNPDLEDSVEKEGTAMEGD